MGSSDAVRKTMKTESTLNVQHKNVVNTNELATIMTDNIFLGTLPNALSESTILCIWFFK
jgi:hypothetical protein